MREAKARVMEAPSSDGRKDDGLEMRRESTTRIGVEPAFGDLGDGDIDDTLPRYPSGNSSAFGAVANFLNSIVGAGIVGLPYALAQSGLWAGMFMICLAGYLTHTSTTMLISAGEKANRLNYEELMAQVFGAAGFHAFNFFAGVVAFGAMSAYLIIVGDTVTEIASATGSTGMFTERVSVILFFGTLLVLPLSSLKDLAKLSYTSVISVLADMLLVLIVVWNGPDESRDVEGIDKSERLQFIRPTIFAGFGAISFAFVCQSSSFLVYRSLAHKSVERWCWVSRRAVSAALLMGLILASAGYGSFVNKTDANILNNFSTEHKAANVARGFLAVSMLLTYPIEMYVARHVLDASVFQTLLGMGPITSCRHYGITLVIWLFSIILAVSTNDLGDIMEIFGAFGASMIGYIMPALLYIRINKGLLRTARAAWRRDSPEYEHKLTRRLRAMHKFFVPFFMVVFGSIALVAGVATSIIDDLTPTKA